jgi:hypothetical protein
VLSWVDLAKSDIMADVSLTRVFLKSFLFISPAAVGAFHYTWTKHCNASPLDPKTEPLYQSSFYKKYNPYHNFSDADVITRRIPISHLAPEIAEDTRAGGSKLVERFTGGIFSGSGGCSTLSLR